MSSSQNYGVWKPIAENIEYNALESNSNAVMAVADTVRTTLGPKGLDKLLIDQAMNRHVSNDGVTILLSLRAIHPVAKMIVEIAERQEQKVGDGTTTAVILAAEMIKEGKRLIRELAVHPTKVVEGIESGVKHACDLLNKSAKKISLDEIELDQIVKTSLSSKLDGNVLYKMVVSALRAAGKDAIYGNTYDFDKSIKVVRRTDIDDKIVNGVVLERRRLDPELPIQVNNAKILILKLDLKPVKESWIKENSKYQDILTMENDRLVKSKKIVDAILETGANTLFIASPEVDQIIEDLFVSKGIFAVHISNEEIEYLSRYTGAKPVRTLDDLKNKDILGTSEKIYEDEDIGIIYLENGLGKKIITILISGSTKEISLERWRSTIDGINAAEAALNYGVVPGGGAAELHLIEKIKQLKLKGLEQVGLEVVTSALESIMRQILTNAGFNGLEKVMTAKASPDGYGVDIDTGEIVDMVSIGIIDPVLVKTMALQASGEMAKSVLRIDKNLAADDLNPQAVADSRR
ncbi:MAG: TCP-1/cpn60 chaperonin family protein [Nitrosopumilus sp.]|nr:TCP-1/cpn60 chaperonin family protein [Nitrosopumilus sp.]